MFRWERCGCVCWCVYDWECIHQGLGNHPFLFWDLLFCHGCLFDSLYLWSLFLGNYLDQGCFLLGREVDGDQGPFYKRHFWVYWINSIHNGQVLFWLFCQLLVFIQYLFYSQVCFYVGFVDHMHLGQVFDHVRLYSFYLLFFGQLFWLCGDHRMHFLYCICLVQGSFYHCLQDWDLYGWICTWGQLRWVCWCWIVQDLDVCWRGRIWGCLSFVCLFWGLIRGWL